MKIDEHLTEEIQMQIFDEAILKEEDPLEDSASIEEIKGTLRRYRDQKQINEGGMKALYETYDNLTDRTVAKAMMKDIADTDGVESFINEAKITAALEHPNIVPVHDLGISESGEPFFTMKLLDGENLQNILDKLNNGDEKYKKLYDNNTLLDIFIKVCEAIAFAHSKGILHMDLKPANIQVSEYGEVLVCDWGLAKSLTDANVDTKDIILTEKQLREMSADVTQNGLLKGSPGYIAPERLYKKSIDIKSDIYSLGAILYSILTHKSPNKSKDLKTIIDNTRKGKIEPPVNRTPDLRIPISLNAVVMKAMELESENRYKNVNAIIEEIKAYRNGFATKAEEAGFITNFLLLIKRHKAISIILFISLISLAVTTGIFINNLKEEKNIAESASVKAQKAEFELQKIAIKSAEQMYIFAINAYNGSNFKTYGELIERTLELNPNNEDAKYELIKLHLGEHNYHEAFNALHEYNGPKDISAITVVVKSAISINNDDSIPQSEKLFAIYRNAGKFIKHAYRLKLHYIDTLTKKYSQQTRLDFCKIYFKEANKNKKKFTYNLKKVEGGYSLSIAGNYGTSSIAPLANLPIVELDISYTDVSDLKFLTGAPIKKLNLRRSRVSQLKALKDSPLEEINISGTNIKQLESLKKCPIKVFHSSHRWVDLGDLKDRNQVTVHIPTDTYSTKWLNRLKFKKIIYFKKN